MEVFKPPHRKLSIFLGGTIENGTSRDWQKMIESELSDENIIIYNPRRDDWNSDWDQSIFNKEFKQQVVWELDHLEKSDIVVMYFVEGTKSPISLLEFGLYAQSGKLIVYCPDGFWRKGNVDIVCERYNINHVRNDKELLIAIKSKINI